MDPTVRIDAMTEADLDAVSRIDPAAETTHEELAGELQRPWSKRWVARDDDGDVVAFVLAWHVADELHVLNVATRADRRRRGIGRALMDALLSYSRAHRIRRLLLEVRRSNDAAIA
ncbi:MAG TPA: GNAT family N-acetyltransferase, partial [Polyangiaceae bacterium]|nr:GNAT family N-acetyltransferase [Polyangiaceae bacterium]